MCAGCIFILLVLPVELWVLWSSPTSPAGMPWGGWAPGGGPQGKLWLHLWCLEFKKKSRKVQPCP